MERYSSEKEIGDLVRSFETTTIEREAWGHGEHLTVALYYIERHDFDTATEKMRAGLLNLLKNGFKLDLSKEMPYHETLTVFWMRTIADLNSSRIGKSTVDKANELVEKFDKDYPLKFYSRERLFSDEARYSLIDGDLLQ